MDNITKCYLNSISNINTRNISFQEKLKFKKQTIKKKILKESKNIICESQMVYQNIPGQTVEIIMNQNGEIVQIKGAKQVEVTAKGEQVQAQVTTDKELIKNLYTHKQQAKQLSPQEAKKLQEGVGSNIFSGLQQGGAMICNGIAYLIEGPGKILSWIPKTLGTLISPQTKQYVQPYKQYQSDMQKTMSEKGKEATQQDLDLVQKKNAEFFKALQEAPDGVILYDKVTKKIYVKHQGKFKVVPFKHPGMAFNEQGAKKSINAAAKKAAESGVPEGSGAKALGSPDGRWLLSNPETAKMFNSGCKKLKLRDKKSQGNFLQMIQKLFASMFGMGGNNEQDNYQEYTDSQRMSFSPFIRKIVKNGTLPPGTYKFEYK